MATENGLQRVDSLDPVGYEYETKAPPEEGPATYFSKFVPAEEFCYYPLDDCRRQIRLCQISLPSERTLELVVSLKVHSLESVTGHFVALSYVWGSKDCMVPIGVNGSKHLITRNLCTQMCRLRKSGYTGMVWIDALCINQLDETEQTAQVELMDRIFRGAEAVFVGLDDNVTHLSEAASDHTLVSAMITEMADGVHFQSMSCFSGREPEAAGDNTAIQLLCRFLDSAWFRRVWVVQEICLARKAKLLLGSGFLSWETFTKAFDQWNRHRRDRCCSSFVQKLDPQLKAAFHRVYSHIASIRHTKIAVSRGQHILEAMLCFQHLSVTVPVDKINGYRGLHSVRAILPPPDYYRSTKEIFEELTVWLLKDRRDLLPLALDLRGDSSFSLPSWVPDYSAKPPIEQNYWRGRLAFYQAYSPKLAHEWDFEHRPAGELCLRGVELDQVTSVAPAILKFLNAAGHLHILQDWFTFATAQRPSPSPDGQLDDELFCATMLGGCVKDPTQASGVRKADAKDHVTWRRAVLGTVQSSAADALQRHVMESHVTAVLGRALFKTRSGSFGVGPPSMKPGDCLWFFNGGHAPFVVRDVSLSTSPERRHVLLGPCYHHELMEAWGTAEAIDLCQSACVLV